jgi:hypothetical protein
MKCLVPTKWSPAHFAELRGLNTSDHNVYSINGIRRGIFQP